jgi:hypothetical protein
MNALLIPNCAEPDAPEVFCKALTVALDDLKVRLQAQFERRFPGEAFRIRKAIEEAEVVAWRTRFPHLLLPDLAEEAIAGLALSTTSEFGH